MTKGMNFEVTIEQIVYEPNIITVYAREDASDEELQKIATQYVLTQHPGLTKQDLVDSVIVSPASQAEEPDVVAEGLHRPKPVWGVKLGLLYAQDVKHAVYDDDEFDEVAYTRNKKDAKQFNSFKAADEFSKWVNPASHVVLLKRGDDDD